jgi:small conductance mechanosensitive channel
MDKFNEIVNNPWVAKIGKSLLVIIIAWLAYKFIVEVVITKLEGKETKILDSKKTKTYIKLLKSIIRYIFVISVVLIILQVFGINISAVIAGVGVLGVVFGLAIQDWLKDIIRGSSILSDDYFKVGDVVKYRDIEGKVIVIGLKTTKIQALKTSNIISIANRNIDEIEVLSNFIYVRVPMPYEVPVKKAEKAIEGIIKRTKEYPNILDCEYIGVTQLADSSIQYLLKVTCNPINKLQTERDTLRAILTGLEDAHIAVPFNQIDVHQK